MPMTDDAPILREKARTAEVMLSCGVADPWLPTKGQPLSRTLHLAEALARDEISPDEYARRRAEVVGRANVLESLAWPLLMMLWTGLDRRLGLGRAFESFCERLRKGYKAIWGRRRRAA